MSRLPDDILNRARVQENGEVEWRLADAPQAINALAAAGHVILGLDLRTYPDGQTFEVPWSTFDPDDARAAADNVDAGRKAALHKVALESVADYAEFAEWIRITWR